MLGSFVSTTIVPLVLRFGLAVIFIFHGLEKVQAGDMGANWAPGMSKPLQMAVAWGELIGGVAVAVGFLTRVAALGLAAIMAGAIVQVHGPHGFSAKEQGYEYNFAILIICAALILLGPGSLAVDRFFRLRRKPI